MRKYYTILFCLIYFFGTSQPRLIVQKGHSNTIENIEVNKDNSLLCSISIDLEMIVWDVKTGNILTQTALPLQLQKINDLFYNIHLQIKFDSLSNNVWVRDSILGDQYVFDIIEGKWNKDGKKVNAREKTFENIAGSRFTIDSMWIQKSNAGVLEFKKTCRYYDRIFTCLDVDPGRNLLIAGNDENKIYVFDSRSGKRLKILSDHTGIVNDVRFTKDGKYFYSCSSDRTILMWDAETLKPVKRFFKEVSVKTALSINVEKTALFVGTETGELFKLGLSDGLFSSSRKKVLDHEITTIHNYPESKMFAGTLYGEVKIFDFESDKTYHQKVINPTLFLAYRAMTIGYDRIPLNSVVESEMNDGLIKIKYCNNMNPYTSRSFDTTNNVAYSYYYLDSSGRYLDNSIWKKSSTIEKSNFSSEKFLRYPNSDLKKGFISIKDYLGNQVEFKNIVERKFIISRNRDGLLYFWNEETGGLMAKILLEGNSRSIFLPNNYYMSDSKSLDKIGFKSGMTFIAPDRFELKFHRPDLVLKALGYNDQFLIDALYRAYLKRLKKMNFTEEMLKDDFQIPILSVVNKNELPVSTAVDSIKIIIKAKDEKYLLDRLNVWVNDVPVFGSSGIDVRKSNVMELEKTIYIHLAKGENKVQFSVLNQAGAESLKETFNINCSKGKLKPDLYLITIGVSEFKDKNYNLTYAAKDAGDLQNLFANNTHYKNIYSKKLINNQVVSDSIIGLKHFLKNADINDHVIVFFAGHGVLDSKMDYYLAGYDMDFYNPSSNGISYDVFEGLLDGIKPLQKIIFLDACHSGEIDKDEVAIVESKMKPDGNIKYRAVGNNIVQKENSMELKSIKEFAKNLFSDLRRGTGATIISSAGGLELAMESETWKNGLFTYCLLNGLKSKAADLNKNGSITLAELQEYVGQKVAEESNGQQVPTSRMENNAVNYRIW